MHTLQFNVSGLLHSFFIEVFFKNLKQVQLPVSSTFGSVCRLLCTQKARSKEQ